MAKDVINRANLYAQNGDNQEGASGKSPKFVLKALTMDSQILQTPHGESDLIRKLPVQK